MSPRRAVVAGVVAAAVALGASARATESARTTVDEPHYLLTALSLWEDGDLDVADERADLRYLRFHEVALPLQAEVRDGGGQVSPHDPLLPVVLAAPAGLGGWLGAKLALAVLCGGAGGGWTAHAAGSHFVDGELTVAGRDPAYDGRAARVAGLLVDREFGLAVWQPAFLLGVPALAAMARRRPPGTWLLVAVVLAGWGTASLVALTMHGWWWPGRQVVVVLPLVVVAVVWWVDGLGRAARTAAAVLASLGVVAYALLAAGATLGWHTLVVDFGRTPNPFVRLARPLLPDLRADGWGTRIALAAWGVLLVAAALLAWRSAREAEPALTRTAAGRGSAPRRSGGSPPAGSPASRCAPPR